MYALQIQRSHRDQETLEYANMYIPYFRMCTWCSSPLCCFWRSVWVHACSGVPVDETQQCTFAYAIALSCVLASAKFMRLPARSQIESPDTLHRGAYSKTPVHILKRTSDMHTIIASTSRCLRLLFWVLCHLTEFARLVWGTGWPRLIGCLKLQIIKRATNYRAFLRKMTYTDKASYDSSPPCRSKCTSSFLIESD